MKQEYEHHVLDVKKRLEELAIANKKAEVLKEFQKSQAQLNKINKINKIKKLEKEFNAFYYENNQTILRAKRLNRATKSFVFNENALILLWSSLSLPVVFLINLFIKMNGSDILILYFLGVGVSGLLLYLFSYLIIFFYMKSDVRKNEVRELIVVLMYNEDLISDEELKQYGIETIDSLKRKWKVRAKVYENNL